MSSTNRGSHTFSHPCPSAVSPLPSTEISPRSRVLRIRSEDLILRGLDPATATNDGILTLGEMRGSPRGCLVPGLSAACCLGAKEEAKRTETCRYLRSDDGEIPELSGRVCMQHRPASGLALAAVHGRRVQQEADKPQGIDIDIDIDIDECAVHRPQAAAQRGSTVYGVLRCAERPLEPTAGLAHQFQERRATVSVRCQPDPDQLKVRLRRKN